MLLCRHCNKEGKSKNSLVQHEIKCPANAERKYPNGMLGKKGGNQFTTGKAIGHSAETKQAISVLSSARRHTDETKKRISIARTKYLQENPDKVPYKINHSSKVSYPEKYFSKCFSGLMNVEREYQVGLYSLDFANIEKKLYLEIDGEQHYVDNRIVESDRKRTLKLAELGWTGYRIRWSEFQKLTSEEKTLHLLDIQTAMQWKGNTI